MYQENRFIYRCVDALLRHRWAFLGALLTVTVLPAAVMQTRPVTYTASASTQVMTEDVAAVLGETPRSTSWVSPATQNINRLNDDLTDDRPGGFLDQAVRQAQLTRPLAVDPRLKNPRLERLRKGISVSSTSDTVFTIGLVWDNSLECERIAQALQHQYIEQLGLSRQAESLAATRFLDDEIAGYAKRMRDSEQALIHYRQTHSGQSPEAQSDDLSQLSLLKSQLDSLQVEAHTAGMKRQALQDRITQIRLAVRVAPVDAASLALPQPKSLLDHRSALLLQGWLPTSDPVRDVDAQIAAQQQEESHALQPIPPKVRRDPVEEALHKNEEYQSLKQQLTETEIANRSQQSQLLLLQQKIASYQTRISSNPSAESELNDRTRDYSSLKTQYEDLVKRREQAQLKANLDKISASSTLKPIGIVYAQSTSSRLKTVLMCLGLLIAGLMVGCLLVLAGEWVDPSLRYEADAERFMGVSVLAGIPERAELRFVPNASDRSPGKKTPRPGRRSGAERWEASGSDEGEEQIRRSNAA